MSGLTGKQKKFAIEYVQCLNATEAARRAGYDGNDRTLAVIGSENLRKPDILAFINLVFDDDIMSAREVLKRLSEIARSDIEDVVDKNGNLDLNKARERGKTHLIKSSKVRTITTDNSDIVEGEVVIHDKMRALEILAKYHSLLVDKVHFEDWHTEILDMYRQGLLSAEQITQELGEEIAQELLITESI